MLKRFILNSLSSFVGAWVALLLFGVVAVVVIAGFIGKFASMSPSTPSVSKHSVLVIDLKGTIEEAETSTTPALADIIRGDIDRPQTLDVLVTAVGEAADNKNIDAIYLKCAGVSAAPATLNALRDALLEFKKSGKKIYAYGDSYAQGDYYVASIADRIFVNPYGEVALRGIGSTSLYMKDLFDKIGVNFQVVKVGTFKSAVEPYIMENMSEPAKAQLDTLYRNMWGFMLDRMCVSRKKLSPASIDSLVNGSITFAPVEKAKEAGLVDELAYERTMDSFIAKSIDVDEEKLNYVTPSALVTQTPWTDAYGSKDQIAVLYATGEIIDGGEGIDYQKLVPVITKLAKDDNVKGMVLRVNSPGGSAFGSDQIGEALDYFRKTCKKPLAVSMGDYAASGGYWISCGADIIFADPLTITGSIGIFGLIPNGKNLLEKLGVNPQTTSTNPGTNFPNLMEPLDERQLAVMQEYVNRGYDRFINRVATGRHMKPAQVRRIAEGRVWDAMKARQIGLVDSLGSLKKAIEWTATKANIYDKYAVSAYPTVELSLWNMIPVNGTMQKLTRELVRENFEQFCMDYVRSYLTRAHIQARMPEIKVVVL